MKQSSLFYEKITLSCVILFLVILLSFTLTVEAHFNGQDSVHNGSELVYEDHTQYDDALSWADTRWSNVKSSFGIYPNYPNFQGNVVKVYDDSDPTSPDYGRYYFPPLYKINLYTVHMDAITTTGKRIVVTHEFGHALGLDHSYSGQIMHGAFSYSTSGFLQSHDIADFRSLWGY